MKFRFPLAAALGLFALAPAANAQFLGTSVTGSLQFTGNPTNYFDPSNGFVPAIYLNSAGTTVTVADPAVEFGFDDGANTDTVQITDNSITLSDVAVGGGGNLPFVITLTDPAFGGSTFTKVIDSFGSGVLYSLTGNTLTFNVPATTGPATFTALFSAAPDVTATPEPGSVALLVGMGVTGAGVLRRRRK